MNITTSRLQFGVICFCLGLYIFVDVTGPHVVLKMILREDLFVRAFIMGAGTMFVLFGVAQIALWTLAALTGDNER